MKTTVKLLVMLLFTGITAMNAQEDEKAGKILDQLFNKIQSSPSVSMDFTIAISSPRDNFSDEFQGHMIIKGDRFRLEVMETETWFDGTSTYTYMPGINEVIISEPDEEGGIMSNPARLFSDYRKDFKYKFIAEVNRDGRRLYEIDLHPRDLDEMFHTVKLFADRDQNFLHSAVIAGKDGNNYTFKVKNFDDTRQVPGSYFEFREEDHPGVEVIDMRW